MDRFRVLNFWYFLQTLHYLKLVEVCVPLIQQHLTWKMGVTWSTFEGSSWSISRYIHTVTYNNTSITSNHNKQWHFPASMLNLMWVISSIAGLVLTLHSMLSGEDHAKASFRLFFRNLGMKIWIETCEEGYLSQDFLQFFFLNFSRDMPTYAYIA